MIYLMQILHVIPLEDLDTFFAVFSDLSEAEELGYTPEEYVNECLTSHFGMSFEDSKQLESFTQAIVKPGSLKAAVGTAKILRNFHEAI